jgi:hypothetical protein
MKATGIFLGIVLMSGTLAHARDVSKTYELLNKGKALSASDAMKLEARAERKPQDEEARIELLSYYATAPAGADLAGVRAARARHILWLIEHDPKEGLGLFQVSTGVYRLHCQGDDLADADAAKRAGELWIQELKKKPADTDIRRSAVAALQFCSPEKAEEILRASRDAAGLGRLYANAALGVTGLAYTNSDPAGTDAGLRSSAFGQRALSTMEEAKDKDFVVAATISLLRDGGILWADGKLDWDYTALGKSLLAKGKQLAPDEILLMTLPTELPARGERPASTIRVGGNVQQAKMLRSVAPHYPPTARAARIQGTVELTALIGLDGRVAFLRPEAGPTDLVPASVEAVRQWQYQPTLLNGKPCYVVTRIDVHFEFSVR